MGVPVAAVVAAGPDVQLRVDLVRVVDGCVVERILVPTPIHTGARRGDQGEAQNATAAQAHFPAKKRRNCGVKAFQSLASWPPGLMCGCTPSRLA